MIQIISPLLKVGAGALSIDLIKSAGGLKQIEHNYQHWTQAQALSVQKIQQYLLHHIYPNQKTAAQKGQYPLFLPSFLTQEGAWHLTQEPRLAH